MRRIVAAVLLTLVGVGGRGEARGDVIFSNLGPGDSFDSSQSWFVGGLNSSVGQSFGLGARVAMPFTVATGPDVVFTGAELALSYTEGPNSLEVQLATDAAGLPGAVLESIAAAFPSPAALVSVASSSLPVLTAGTTYWIIASVDLTGTTGGGWNFTSPAVTGPIAFQQDSGSGPGGWFATNTTGAAFRVTGSAVPEPPAFALAALGGLGLAGVLRRRRAG